MRSYVLIRDLERRFDGDVPYELRHEALAGGQIGLAQITARSNSNCCDQIALSAARTAALLRQNGDIGHWRREGLHWIAHKTLYADIAPR